MHNIFSKMAKGVDSADVKSLERSHSNSKRWSTIHPFNYTLSIILLGYTNIHVNNHSNVNITSCILKNCILKQCYSLQVSAAVHEVIIALSFGFFYPVLLVIFGIFGVLMVPLTATSGRRYPHIFNLLMWLSFFIGNGNYCESYSYINTKQIIHVQETYFYFCYSNAVG